MPDPISLLNAALAGRYLTQRELRAGDMATAYLADDLKNSRDVVLKVLKPEVADMIGPERFRAKIEPVARLRGRFVVPILDFGATAGLTYYMVPFTEGESLRERLERDGPLAVPEALSITKDVATALEHAHSLDILHLELRPTNVFLARGEALVSDFGVAHAITEAARQELTLTGIYAGTPNYMSPEQIGENAPIDARSDVYALGCLLYEMLTGERPFPGTPVQAMVAKGVGRPVAPIRSLRPGVPEAIEAAIDLALEKNPSDRFGSALELYEACRAR
jgi:eukaryotic-like serine/threonine-protein kinase